MKSWKLCYVKCKNFFKIYCFLIGNKIVFFDLSFFMNGELFRIMCLVLDVMSKVMLRC